MKKLRISLLFAHKLYREQKAGKYTRVKHMLAAREILFSILALAVPLNKA